MRPPSGEVAIKQDVALELMDSRRRTQGLIEVVNCAERQSRPAIAEDDWRYDDVKTIDTAGR